MRKANRPKRPEYVAYHEAGHAVAGWRLHIPFTSVTIEPVEGQYLGCVFNQKYPRWFRPDIELTPRVRLRVEHEVIVHFAGQIAEAKFRGRRPRWGMESDNREAVGMAIRVFEPGETLDAYLHYCFLASRDLMGGNWASVQALATALLERDTLSHEEAVEVIAPGSKALRESLLAPLGHLPPSKATTGAPARRR